MKKYICDGCEEESMDKDEIPEYKMFVCNTYDGTEVMLCNRCERRIKDIMEGKSPDPNVHKVEPCHDYIFHGVGCLEDRERYGFFKSNADVRPSSCAWIKKEDAEKLYNIMKTKGD